MINFMSLEEKKIKKVKKNRSSLEVEWGDGEKSKFNYMWLRDNCPTAHDKDTRHRMFNILKVSTSINPKKYSIKEDGKLTTHELLKVFNCGIGMMIFIEDKDKNAILNLLPKSFIIGHVIKK